MDKNELSFLVIGAGAIGGITAALLKKNGYDVEIVCRQEEYAKLISNEGIEVSGVCGNFKITLPAYTEMDKVNGKKDIILHATKANEMTEAAESARSVLKDNGRLVSMQNGFCEDELAKVLGGERIIGCVTGWGATMKSPGKLEMTSTGDFILGYPSREPDDFLNSLAWILSCIRPARVTSNIRGHLYSKLIINSCITSLGVICGMYLGKMLSVRRVRNIFIQVIREAVEVADKMEINPEVFGGKLDFRKFVIGDDLFSNIKRHLLILIIGFKYRRLKSSSLQSVLRGRKTEVDYLNGYIVRNGNQCGVDVTVNQEIVKMIHEIEMGMREITINNFDNPAFRKYTG